MRSHDQGRVEGIAAAVWSHRNSVWGSGPSSKKHDNRWSIKQGERWRFLVNHSFYFFFSTLVW